MPLRARLLDLLLRLAARLPLPLLHRLGDGLGRLASRLPGRERHVARVNIQLCFPDRPLAERQALVTASLQESIKGLLELGPIWHRPLSRVLSLVREVEGEEAVERALAEGRGLLVIAPHHGSWELLQMWLAQQTRLHALYRPPRQHWLEPLLVRGRSRSGATFWPARPSGIRALFKALRAGEAVGVLPDQQPPGEGVYVPFFGQPAKTMTLFCKLAARSEAPVIIGWAQRLPRGAGYRLHWHRVEDNLRDPDAEKAATAMNRAIERVVAGAPAQYQWTYRRFQRRPQGRDNPYKRWVSDGGWVRDSREDQNS